jgi:signal transduction histidine kinase
VVDLSDLARRVTDALREGEPEREVELVISPDLTARGDPRLLQVALENLLGNAWKFTRKTAHACIELGRVPSGCGLDSRGQTPPSGYPAPVYFVRDNGAGFDMAYAEKLFAPFQRLHGSSEFEGTGIGLATVQRIVHRHGGRIWAEGAVGEGANFYFTLQRACEEAA